MLTRTLFTLAAAVGTLAFAASAHAAYLSMGTSNTSNATTTLAGTTAGPELWIKNAYGSSAGAFGIYGLLTATAPTASSAALRGANSSTNAYGYGVWGSQAGAGTGVYGFTPSGRGVWGSSTSGTGVYGSSASGTGARGQSASGTGLYGVHSSSSGTAAGVTGLTNSTAANAYSLYGLLASTSPGANSAAVRGQNNGTSSNGFGVWGSQAGYGTGVYGSSTSGTGIYGHSTGGYGVEGSSDHFGVYGTSSGYGVLGTSSDIGVGGTSPSGWGVYGSSTSDIGVAGSSSSDRGVFGSSGSGTGVYGYSSSGIAVYGQSGGSSDAGHFSGNVDVTGALTVGGGCTGCAGPSALQIDDPLDPAHKYLQHSTVASSQQLDIYSGNVSTNEKGFATVTMPRWFQALNRSFRYQLTILGHAPWDTQARIWNEIKNNRFTIRTSRPRVKVSWQVTGVRHDRYANAHPVRVIAPKAKADQGKYVHPELYGKPKTDAIGYQKPRKEVGFRKPPSPPKLPTKAVEKR